MADERKVKVYLSGPIADVEDPRYWRDDAVKAFDSHVECRNPMDWQDVYDENAAAGARKDLGEMFGCDVLLVNLTDAPEGGPCAGTRAEVAMWGAWQIIEQMQEAVLHGPCILVFKDEEQEKRFEPWVTMIGRKTFYDIEKAVQWLNLESSTWTTGGEPVNASTDKSNLEPEDASSGLVDMAGNPVTPTEESTSKESSPQPIE